MLSKLFGILICRAYTKWVFFYFWFIYLFIYFRKVIFRYEAEQCELLDSFIYNIIRISTYSFKPLNLSLP